jgi:zinc protease
MSDPTDIARPASVPTPPPSTPPSTLSSTAPPLGLPVAAPVSWAGLGPSREVLPNGVTVIVRETRTTPAVTMHVCLTAGTVLDPPGLDGLAHFVSRTIDRGTEARTGDQIAEAFDAWGASLAVAVNRHTLSLVCTCLAEDVADVMALLADIVRHPSFPEAEVETRRGEIATLIQQDADNPATVAMEALLEALYGESHPFGRRSRGTLGSVARIDRGALRVFHADAVGPTRMTLAIVGDISARAGIDAAQQAFGDWSEAGHPALPLRALPLLPRSPAPSLPPPVPPSARRVRVVPMMNKSQADIAYGFVTVARDDPRYGAYWLLNNILGQYALGGRLGERIRERQGMAYYVSSAFDPSPIPSPLIIRAGVSAANVERALASIDAELSAFIADGPTDREMAESTQYLIGSLPRQLETNVAIAKFLVVSEFFGLGTDYELRVPALLASVTREQVQAVARESLDPSHATIVVAGPYDGSPV